jgi:hypothetical protein
LGGHIRETVQMENGWVWRPLSELLELESEAERAGSYQSCLSAVRASSCNGFAD